MSDLFEAGGLEADAPRPLADRLRPKTLADVVGQDHLIGPDGPIGRMIAANRPHSIVLWGLPQRSPPALHLKRVDHYLFWP